MCRPDRTSDCRPPLPSYNSVRVHVNPLTRSLVLPMVPRSVRSRVSVYRPFVRLSISLSVSPSLRSSVDVSVCSPDLSLDVMTDHYVQIRLYYLSFVLSVHSLFARLSFVRINSVNSGSCSTTHTHTHTQFFIYYAWKCCQKLRTL